MRMKDIRWCPGDDMFDATFDEGRTSLLRDVTIDEVRDMRKMLKKAWKDYKKYKKDKKSGR